MVRVHAEKGSELVEAVMVLPLLIVLAFCIMQGSLIAYEGSAMSSAIESASLKSDFAAAIASGNINQTVKKELESNTPGIVGGGLTVSDSEILYNTNDTQAVVENDPDITTISKEATTATLTFKVEYKIPTLIAIGAFDGLNMTKDIKVNVPVAETMEVSR